MPTNPMPTLSLQSVPIPFLSQIKYQGIILDKRLPGVKKAKRK